MRGSCDRVCVNSWHDFHQFRGSQVSAAKDFSGLTIYILNSTIVPVPFMETQRLLKLQFHIPNKIPPINCSTTHQHFRNNSSSDQLNLCSSLILFSDLLPLTSLTRFRSTVMAFEGKACIRSISSSLNASFDAEISVVS